MDEGNDNTLVGDDSNNNRNNPTMEESADAINLDIKDQSASARYDQREEILEQKEEKEVVPVEVNVNKTEEHAKLEVEGSSSSSSLSVSSKKISMVEEALNLLKEPDSILEPTVFDAIQKFIKGKGTPGRLITQLAGNYQGYPQMVELLKTWIIAAGMGEEEMHKLVMDHVLAWISERFDAQSVDDAITKKRKTTKSLAWLRTLMDDICRNRQWRHLIHSLADNAGSESFFLDLTVKTMATKGHFVECTKHPNIARRQEVFSLVLGKCIVRILTAESESIVIGFINHLERLSCFTKAAFIYTMSMLTHLHSILENNHYKQRITTIVAALDKHCVERGLNGLNVSLLLQHITTDASNPVLQCVNEILLKQQFSMANLTFLLNEYRSDNMPAVEYIQNNGFIGLLLTEVYVKEHSSETQTHACRYLLALATCKSAPGSLFTKVGDEENGVDGDTKHSDTVQRYVTETMNVIREVCTLSKSVKRDVWVNFNKFIHLPVACCGMFLYIHERLTTSVFFLNFSKSSPPQMFGLLEKISVQHPDLWPQVLVVLEKVVYASSSLQALVKVSVCEFVMDRLLHLMMIGCVIPTLNFVHALKETVDSSVLAYFVHKICLHLSSFSAEFIEHIGDIIFVDNVIPSLRLVSGCRHVVVPAIVSMSTTTDISRRVKSELENAVAQLRLGKA
eukprot:m.29617 g.29617  ORF g.29617 m.29617 type:complete len:679 (-) comp6171_c0_seq1:1828-3864(-)